MIALLLFLVLLAIGGVTLQFFVRGAAIQRIMPLDEDVEALVAGSEIFCQSFERLTNTGFSPNNELEILTNGGVFPRLVEDLRAAESLITWQVFWFKPGGLAEQIRKVLEERARAGVRVYCLFDFFGSYGLPSEYRDSLRDAGVHVATFRPLAWKSLYKVQQRSHVRSVVIDGKVGYTGGFGIDDSWLGNGRKPGEWRDTSVRLVGVTVDQLQAAFVVNWAESTGELLMGNPLFALDEEDRQGSTDAGILYTDPGLGSTNAERFFALSIAAAQKELYVTTAYFLPTRDLRAMLMNASKRGVDVRVLTPGRNTDHAFTWYAGRSHYRELIEAGVRIYEYEPTMVHAKTLVVDRVWSALGTVNFDNRSIVLNDEVLLLVRDEEVGRKLHTLFLEDLEYANEVSLEEHEGRGTWARAQEQAARVVAPFL